MYSITNLVSDAVISEQMCKIVTKLVRVFYVAPYNHILGTLFDFRFNLQISNDVEKRTYCRLYSMAKTFLYTGC